MKKFVLLVVIVIAIFFFYRRANAPGEQQETPKLPVTEERTTTPEAQPSPAISTPSEEPVAAPESPATQPLLSSELAIRVTEPAGGATVHSPMTIKGEVDLPVDALFVEVKDTKGNVRIAEPVRVKKSAEGKGAFSITLQYVFTQTKEGSVEVFAKEVNGTEGLRVIVPVKFE